MNNRLTIALPKGRLGSEVLGFLSDAGLPSEGVDTASRTLLFDFPDQEICYLICKPTDVPTFVEYGAADLGVVGKDTIEEEGRDVFELADLGFGYCRFAVAVTRELRDKHQVDGVFPLEDFSYHRVATKFVNVADRFFRSMGMQMEIIKLNGNIELAPRVGLADMIVDIVSTGTTLRQNGLVEVEELFPATARLIANRVSYRMKNEEITEVVDRMNDLLRRNDDDRL